MKVLYQPTQSTPGDWQECDSADWASVGSFPLHAVCVQGVVFEGPDHYSVEILDGETQVVTWHDDPDDWPAGQRWARVIRFPCLCPDADPRMGGALNTHQTHTIYAESGIIGVFQAAYAGNPLVEIKPWTDFDPNRVAPLDGQWVSDAQHAAHQGIRAVHGWREWTEGLDVSELDQDGRVKAQRAQGRYEIPKGTRTYYHNPADLATGTHAAVIENGFGTSASGAATETAGVGHNGDLAFAVTTPANEPDSAAWPTTGVYRYQLDVTLAGADLTFGLLSQGGEPGHFARVNSGLTADQESFTQDEAAFSGSGLHLATVTNPAWTSGASTDRFEVTIAGVRTAGHGTQDLTLQLGETDDFADGPWAAPAPAPEADALWFGPNF